MGNPCIPAPIRFRLSLFGVVCPETALFGHDATTSLEPRVSPILNAGHKLPGNHRAPPSQSASISGTQRAFSPDLEKPPISVLSFVLLLKGRAIFQIGKVSHAIGRSSRVKKSSTVFPDCRGQPLLGSGRHERTADP